MDSLIDDILRVRQRCERSAAAFHNDPVESIFRQLMEATTSMKAAWSGSWVGYQAYVYTKGLRPKQPQEHFSIEYGLRGGFGQTRGDWCEYPYEVIRKEILHRAGDPDIKLVAEAAENAKKVFAEAKSEFLPTLQALLSGQDDRVLKGLEEELASLKDHVTYSEIVAEMAPKKSTSCAEQKAILEGLRTPHHLALWAGFREADSYGVQVKRVGEIARHAGTYLQAVRKMKGKTVARTSGPIFIGHGRSEAWKALKELVVDRLGLQHEEFNRKPFAGLSTKERLQEMLERCCFAFLVMTGEDEQPDGRLQARQNVVHEAGLFQGRYGFERAIVLLEEGCEGFSNMDGVGVIQFPKGDIMAKSEEIRRVLEREGILSKGQT